VGEGRRKMPKCDTCKETATIEYQDGTHRCKRCDDDEVAKAEYFADRRLARQELRDSGW
jgi:ribosomal protein L37AE/L43A